MFDHNAIYQVLDGHFVMHLVREGESISEDAESGNEADGAQLDTPEIMLEDLIDEIDGALEELHVEYNGDQKCLVAIIVGFVDGALAQSDGLYTSYEDAYVEDMRNARFTAIDDVVDSYAADFDGNRNWGEAAMGYIRHAVDADEDAPENLDGLEWQARAKGFIWGADVAEDYGWRFIQIGNGVVVTDEEALDEYSMRQFEASGGDLLGRISNALGIDLGEIATALEEAAGEEAEEIEDAEAGESKPQGESQ